MTCPPRAWMAETAAVSSVVLFPAMAWSTNRSISHTDGLTAAPPPWGGAEIVVLMPPVDAYAATPCSWYCHRLCSAGCQHVLQATGVGSAAPAGAALSASAISASAAGATLRRKRMSIESSSSDEREWRVLA